MIHPLPRPRSDAEAIGSSKLDKPTVQAEAVMRGAEQQQDEEDQHVDELLAQHRVFRAHPRSLGGNLRELGGKLRRRRKLVGTHPSRPSGPDARWLCAKVGRTLCRRRGEGASVASRPLETFSFVSGRSAVAEHRGEADFLTMYRLCCAAELRYLACVLYLWGPFYQRGRAPFLRALVPHVLRADE